MEIFPLHIFPVSSLASTIIPVVWVGMFVVCFFNVRFGWGLTGLVVPGYLVPLMLTKPLAAAVVFFEGGLTYFLVWWFSEYSSRWAPWSNFFGRDRFFALVLCSIVVRLLLDGWLLPEMGEWINETFNLNFDYRNHLHSFGLIIVALIANQFWKTGFINGLIPFIVVIFSTLIIVRYGLMELTNFGLGNISYLYEDMAASILASPKAYIVLVTTAFLASRMNLHYGWDFNGILIPSLLALQWYQPEKIVATIVESGIILLIATLLLRTAWLKKTTIEGARKLLLFFNVSFAYKILLGYALLYWFPTLKATDYFGFGYLLATLMAVKIHDKAILARLTRATLQTSLMAVIVASIIGFSLTLLPISNLLYPADAILESPPEYQGLRDEDLNEILKQEEVKLYQAKVNNRFSQPLAHETESFSRALKLIKKYLQNSDPELLAKARIHLNNSGFLLEVVENQYLYIHEKRPITGHGIYIIDLINTNGMAVSLPAAMDERGIYDAGIAFFKTFKGCSLAISGSSRRASPDYSSDVLQNRTTFFHQFHKLFAKDNSIQLRLFSSKFARQLVGSRRNKDETEITGLESMLWVSQGLPERLDLVKLEQVIDEIQIEWSSLPFINYQRDDSKLGFAELVLTKQAIRKLMFKPFLLDHPVDNIEQDLRIDGYLQEWMLNSKHEIATKGSEQYQRPTQGELLFIDEQIMTPMLKLLEQYTQTEGWSETDLENLQLIAQAASVFGYQLIHYKHLISHEHFLILSEQANHGHPLKHWGTYVFRLGKANNYVIQVPRSLYEVNSFEFGISLFERIKARAILISTTHPFANIDGSSDLIASNNKVNVFNMVDQVFLRENPHQEMMMVSTRAFSFREDQPELDADLLFASDKGVFKLSQLSILEQQLIQHFQKDGLNVQMVDGSDLTVGYEVGNASQVNYLPATQHKHYAMLWLSPLVRANYRQQDENQWQSVQFSSMNINTESMDLSQFVIRHPFIKSTSALVPIKEQLQTYVKTTDVISLQNVVQQLNQLNYRFKRIIDSSSKQAFLVIMNSQENILAIANLVPRTTGEIILKDDDSLRFQINLYVDQRTFWAQMGGA